MASEVYYKGLDTCTSRNLTIRHNNHSRDDKTENIRSHVIAKFVF